MKCTVCGNEIRVAAFEGGRCGDCYKAGQTKEKNERLEMSLAREARVLARGGGKKPVRKYEHRGTPETKICAWCGETFETALKFKIYCRESCQWCAQVKSGNDRKSALREPCVKICKWCGEEFTAKRHQLYCSSRCRVDSAYKRREDKEKNEGEKK